MHVPLHGWLRLLAAGWRFPSYVVEPMHGHHGAWSVLMIKDASP
jgi:hypothetical protein